MRVRIDIDTDTSFINENPNQYERDITLVLHSSPPDRTTLDDNPHKDFRKEVEQKFKEALDYIFGEEKDEEQD